MIDSEEYIHIVANLKRYVENRITTTTLSKILIDLKKINDPKESLIYWNEMYLEPWINEFIKKSNLSEIEKRRVLNQRLLQWYGLNSIADYFMLSTELYNSYFKTMFSDPAFQFQVLFIQSQLLVDEIIEQERWVEKSKLPYGRLMIQGRLEKQNQFISSAKNLLAQGQIEIFEPYKNQEFHQDELNDSYGYLLFLRIENDYYLQNTSVDDQIDLINIIAEYVLLRRWLENELSQTEQKELISNEEVTSIKVLFAEECQKDWQQFLKPLTNCRPRILKEDGLKYVFIGSQKLDRGVIAMYFNYLKSKGIVNVNKNRQTIAKVLTNCIDNYHISESVLNNSSNRYDKIFKKQLELTDFNKLD